MKYYTHVLDVCFSVTTTESDHQKISVSYIIAALQKRIAEIHSQEVQNPGTTEECFSLCDRFGMTEKEAKTKQQHFAY